MSAGIGRTSSGELRSSLLQAYRKRCIFGKVNSRFFPCDGQVRLSWRAEGVRNGYGLFAASVRRGALSLRTSRAVSVALQSNLLRQHLDVALISKIYKDEVEVDLDDSAAQHQGGSVAAW